MAARAGRPKTGARAPTASSRYARAVRTCGSTIAALISLAVTATGARAEPLAEAITLPVQTRTAAYRLKGAPSAVVHAPRGFDPAAPLHLVVFLHGYRGCAQVLASAGSTRCRPGDAVREGWNLAGHHDAAGTNTLLVIPQLAFMQRSGRPGCFAERGCFRRFIAELLAEHLAAALGSARARLELSSLTLVAHSAGFETALAILEHGEVSAQVRAVVLMDALYSGSARYARWLLERAPASARMLSIHVGRGGPARQSARLLKTVQRALGPARAAEVELAALAEALRDKRLVVTRTRAPHRLVPAQHLAHVLAALGLPSRRD
jgi:hypothetical protein